jgi:PDDEXK-like domain of unknown function (DUF3799)
MIRPMPLKSIKWSGKAITEPGMYSNIALETYHRNDICDGPSVSSSGLRELFAQSPAHFFTHWSGNPDCIEREDKKHFILGRALHHLALGEAFFSLLFDIPPATYRDKKTGAVKAWTYSASYCREWKAHREKLGKAVLQHSDYDRLHGMLHALESHSIVQAGALNGLIERSIFMRDKATGLWLKSRPDSIPDSSVDFVDIKITRSVRWYDLQRTIADYGYHQQGALICHAGREVLGIENPTFTLCFVEQEAPFCIRFVTLKDVDLDRGHRQNRMALDVIARCLASQHWPGPGGDRADAENIELSQRVQDEIDNRLQYGLST